MVLRSTFLIAAVLFAACGFTEAAAIPTIILKSTRSAALNDGRDFHEIMAEVRDNGGRYVADGTAVTFQSTLGQFIGPNTASTRAGTARIRLVSLQKGTANITAAVAGGGFQQAQFLFTDDPAETFQGNVYMILQGTASTIYYPGIRYIEAMGKTTGERSESGLPGASLTYRNIQLFADFIQLDANSNTVRASGNVHLNKAGRRLKASRLYLPLMSGDGFAITEHENRIRPVRVKGSDLSVSVPENGVPQKFFESEDLSQHSHMVVARQIKLFPNEKLQFNRPRFYQDGQQILSMAFYSMMLYSNTLISEQMLSVGSQGLGIDIPLYYDLSPVSMGMVHLRHGEQNGRSAFATRPGLSLDLVQAYNSNGGSKRFAGEVNVTGINRSDWGLQWNHSQEIGADTLASFYMDVPQHRALFAQANLSKQWNGVRLMANLSGNRSLSGFSASGTQADISLGTMPRKVGKTGYHMSFTADASMIRNKTLGFTNSIATQGVNMQLTSQSFRLGKATSLTNYFSVGQLWADQGQGGANLTSNFTLMHSFGPNASMQLAYDYQRRPLTILGEGNNKLSTMLRMSGGSKWDFFLFGSTMLDARNTTLVSDFSYSLAPRWRLNFSSTVQHFTTASYRDFTLGIARTIGGRDIAISYSTFNHRFFFDLQASRF